MKKQVLKELDEIKYLFGYKRGVVISEQRGNTTTTTTTINAGSLPMKKAANWKDVVKYFSANTDSHWSFVGLEIYTSNPPTYQCELIKMKSTDTNEPDATLWLYSDDSDMFADLYGWKGRSGSIDGHWEWDGSRPVIKFESKTTGASGYIQDTDLDWSAVTDDKKVIGLNAKGPLVKNLQNKLINYGYSGSTNSPITPDVEGCKNDEAKCDGIYGASTKEMVRQLQTDYGLDVDGVVGQQTAYAIFQ
jgi:hypothetical protein